MFVLQLVLFLFFQGDLFIQFRSKSNCFVRLLQTYRQRFSKISRRKSLECFYRNIYLIKRSIVLIGLERLFNKVIDLRPANLLKRNSSTGIFTFFDNNCGWLFLKVICENLHLTFINQLIILKCPIGRPPSPILNANTSSVRSWS